MEATERLVSKAYEWIDQVSYELKWDSGYTESRKGVSRHFLSYECEPLVAAYPEQEIRHYKPCRIYCATVSSLFFP